MRFVPGIYKSLDSQLNANKYNALQYIKIINMRGKLGMVNSFTVSNIFKSFPSFSTNDIRSRKKRAPFTLTLGYCSSASSSSNIRDILDPHDIWQETSRKTRIVLVPEYEKSPSRNSASTREKTL